MISFKEINWWVPDDTKSFEKELKKELSSKHPLYSKRRKLKGVAKASYDDDVLFTDEEKYYMVHLSWGEREKSAKLPYYEEYPNLEAFHNAIKEKQQGQR